MMQMGFRDRVELAVRPGCVSLACLLVSYRLRGRVGRPREPTIK